MDQSFFNDFVRVFSNGNGRPEYTPEVELGDDNAWHIILYNYTSKQWIDMFDSQPGQMSNIDNGLGWSIFETHYTVGPCSDVPSLSMSGLRLHYSHTKGQDWQYASEGGHEYGPFGDCFHLIKASMVRSTTRTRGIPTTTAGLARQILAKAFYKSLRGWAPRYEGALRHRLREVELLDDAAAAPSKIQPIDFRATPETPEFGWHLARKCRGYTTA